MIILCRICLRSGLRTKDIDENLVFFHDEICDFDAFEVPILSFCSICKYQLKKFYNFKKKCLKAHKILKAKRNELNKTKIENLHKLMTPYSIEFLTTSRQGVFSCIPGLKPSLQHQNKVTNNNFDIPRAAEVPKLIEESIKVEHNAKSVLVTQNTTDNTETESKPDLEHFKVALPATDNSEVHTEVEDSYSFSYCAIDCEETKVEELSDSDLDDEQPLSKCVITKNNAEKSTKENVIHKSDNIKQIINNSIKKTETPKKSIKDLLTIKDVNFLGKMKMTKSEKQLIKIEKGVWNLKERVLRLIDEGNLDLGENETLTKEQFLEMFAKYDKNRLQTNGMLKKGCGGPARLRKFIKQLMKRFSPEYETVFDIEYLNTCEAKLAEFRARKDNKLFLTSEFKCEICFKWFDKKSLLDYHNTWHEPSRQHGCDICSMRFCSRKQLTSHLNSTHYSVYRCKLCDVLTYNFDAMVNHYHQHRGMKYICNICLGEFRSRSSLNTHRLTHTTHQCTHCLHRFLSFGGLNCHHRIKHPNAPPLNESCAKCDVNDATPPCRHKREKYEQFKCRNAECNLFFKTASEMRQHAIETKHIQTRPQYKTWGQRRKGGTWPSRDKVTGPDKPYRTCPICQEQVPNTSRTALFRHHTDKHPSEPYTSADVRDTLCEYCGKSFLAYSTYRDHLNVHLGVRPYACSVCPSRFHMRRLLIAHRERHRPPRHECIYCGKKFFSSANLLVHKRTHIGDRRFKCEICLKGFLHSGALKEHINGVHNQVRRTKKTTRKLNKSILNT